MKFGKRMQEEMIQVWAEHYVNYKRLKRVIFSGEDINNENQTPNPDLTTESILETNKGSVHKQSDITKKSNNDFIKLLFRVVREELAKSETHMKDILEELEVQFSSLTALVSNHEFQEAVHSTSRHRPSVTFPRNQVNIRRNRRNRGSGRSGAEGHDTLPSSDSCSLYNQLSNDSIYSSYGSFSQMDADGGYTTPSNDCQNIGVYGSCRTSTVVFVENNEKSGPLQNNKDSKLIDDSNISLWKRLTVLILNLPKSSEVAATESARKRFVEFYAAASRLMHFAELNIEAIRKTNKKTLKNRPRCGDLTSRFETEIRTSSLSSGIMDIMSMIDKIKVDFRLKFNENLEQYEAVSMAGSETWHWKKRYLLLAFVLYIISINSPIFAEHPQAHACFSLFVIVITLWITEAIPFFCTAMLIPIIAVPSRILQDPKTGDIADHTVASQIILGKVFDHVQILTLGGLTIAKAISCTHLEVTVVRLLHRYTAHNPEIYLLGVMILSCVVCMFVSNVASPLLVLGVIQPTLWEFPSNTNAPIGILLGLAFACNLGGMLSPIASPQNAIAMEVLSFAHISFAKWVGLALPVVILSVLFTWWLILKIWRPFDEVQYIPLQGAFRGRPVSPQHKILVIVVSTITVILWCIPSSFLFGDTGVIALIPMVVFFGAGVLKKEDFNTLSWHLMFLLAGGSMLGICANDSKMLDLMADSLKATLESQSPYVTLVAILGLVCLITSFVSHTVAAMVLLPSIAKFGLFLPKPHHQEKAMQILYIPDNMTYLTDITPDMLVYFSMLMCSAAMAFPTSSFPNVNSLLAEDDVGKPYLKAKNFLLSGSLVTLFFFVCCITWMIPYFNFLMK
eukprot:Tbor_TRINITY_DN3398_c0_g1::TRINITY_DN3398_c0_g1_i1::g.23541::m.23541/K14430/PHO87_91; phosphate transporter